MVMAKQMKSIPFGPEVTAEAYQAALDDALTGITRRAADPKPKPPPKRVKRIDPRKSPKPGEPTPNGKPK